MACTAPSRALKLQTYVRVHCWWPEYLILCCHCCAFASQDPFLPRPKSSAAATTDAGLRRYGPGRVITLHYVARSFFPTRFAANTENQPTCRLHDLFLYVLASATYSSSYTVGFRIFYKDTMKCISMCCYREAGKTYVYSMHGCTHISQYNLCSCW
jgi:hypothetical protein